MNNNQNAILIAFQNYQNKVGLKISPDRKFYQKVGIKQKRWGQLIRGEKSPLLDEIKNISESWGIPMSELIQ